MHIQETLDDVERDLVRAESSQLDPLILASAKNDDPHSDQVVNISFGHGNGRCPPRPIVNAEFTGQPLVRLT